MGRRAWRAYVRIGEWRQHLLRALAPGRMHFVSHAWPLRPETCACDVHLCDYLERDAVRGRAIFHLGTGGHHLVGLRNHGARWGNDILGLTLSPGEHARYVRLVIRDPALAAHYKVLFGDLYSLSAAMLPTFDIVALFHLCEFGDQGSAARRLDDAGVVRAFCARLAADGRLLLYRGSFGYARAVALVQPAVERGWLEFVEDYQSLAIYRKGALPPAAHSVDE